MRVLHVIAGAAVGGAETFAQDAIAALAAEGVAQTVLCRPYPAALARYAAAGIPASGFGFGALDRALGRGRRIAEVARAFGADLVHAWMSRAAAFVPAAMPCPVVGWFGDYYDLKYFRTMDCAIAVTPDIAASIVRRGIPGERVFTVNTFGTMPQSARVARASLDTPAGAPLLLVLARLHRVKGIDIMLHALAALPECYLWLAGEGPQRARYEALARQLGVAARVRFLGWRQDRMGLLDACDICVLPSRYEPFGTVIAEAWAMRRPLVATRADGARQYVRDGENGLLCPLEDAGSLAAAIRRLLAEPALRAALIDGGARAYEADFTREIVLARLLAAYRASVQRGRRAP
jgi:glycosyltransferase involved in cell wall biosynthesis